VGTFHAGVCAAELGKATRVVAMVSIRIADKIIFGFLLEFFIGILSPEFPEALYAWIWFLRTGKNSIFRQNQTVLKIKLN
jgi:hypothetical protein